MRLRRADLALSVSFLLLAGAGLLAYLQLPLPALPAQLFLLTSLDDASRLYQMVFLASAAAGSLFVVLLLSSGRPAGESSTRHEQVLVVRAEQAGGLSLWQVLLFAGLGVLAYLQLVPGELERALPAQLGTARADSYELAWANVAREAPACAGYRELAESAAGSYDVDPLLLAAVWYHESGCDPAAVNSTTRATGLGQVMPSDAWRFAGSFTSRPTSAELMDPALNAEWSAKVLAGALRTNDTLQAALDAYSGGHGAIYYDSVTSIYRRFTAGVQVANKAPGMQAPVQFAGFTDTPLKPMPRTVKDFGVPVNYQQGGTHTGIDVALPRDGAGREPALYAVGDGVVEHVGPLYCDAPRKCRGDQALILNHGDDVYSIYSHNSETIVRPGEIVRAGQMVSRQGNEGYSFGSHLHFEVHVGAPYTGNWRQPWAGGRFVNPCEYIACKG